MASEASASARITVQLVIMGTEKLLRASGDGDAELSTRIYRDLIASTTSANSKHSPVRLAYRYVG